MRVPSRRIAGRSAGPAVAGFQVSFASGGLEAWPLPRHWKVDLAPASNSGVCGTTLSGEPDRLAFC